MEARHQRREVTNTDGDQKALALIGLSVMDHHLPSLGQRETAKAAWDALESVYKAKSMARRVALKREMNSLKKAAEEPMTKYVARAKELQDQLAAAGHTTNDEEVAAALLAGLPPDYDVIVAVLETTADKVDLDVLLGKLLTAEQRLPKTNEPTAPRAYAGAAERAPRGGGRRPPLRCFYCDQLGHMVRDCPKARADRARGANQAAGDNGRGVAMAAVKHVEAGGWVMKYCPGRWILDEETVRDVGYFPCREFYKCGLALYVSTKVPSESLVMGSFLTHIV